MKRLLYTFGLWLLALCAGAQSFEQANALYDSARYEQAARMYREVLVQYPVSAEMWYNLGNAYYQSGSIGFSVAAYRKALKLAPGDDAIRHNLDMAVAHSADKMAPPPPGFLIRQTDLLTGILTPAAWAWITLAWVVCGVGAFLLYIFAPGRRAKKWGLLASGLSWMLAFGFAALAAHRYYYALDSYAVLVARSGEILAEPAENATRLLLLNEGATLIFKKRVGAWIEVELADGSTGFIWAEKVEVI